MIEPVPLTTTQKTVVGKQSNSFKNRMKRENLGFNIKLCFFSPKTKYVCLTMFQSSEHLQNTLLIRLLGKFIELHNT